MSKKHPMVDCDYCGGRFKLKPKVEKVKDDIERVHFKCKHCKHDYTAYYTNNLIKGKQMLVRKTKDVKRRIKLKNDIQKEMDGLKNLFS